MEELNDIFEKYQQSPFDSTIKTEDELNKLAIQYLKDLAELADILCRLINHETHPNYYTLNESTVVGSLTRIIKLYKELISNFEENKLEIVTLFARPLYESFIILKYLIRNGNESQKNFRLISYKSRYENFKLLSQEIDQTHPIIQRQLLKLNRKLQEDGLNIEDLETENNKKNSWKLDGKSFWKIHSEVDFKEMYSFIYGTGSDAIHGNWQEIMDFHLTKKGNGYFSFLNYEKCDCRVIVPISTIIIESLLEFLEWNKCLTEKIEFGLNIMLKINQSIYIIWEEKFGEEIN